MRRSARATVAACLCAAAVAAGCAMTPEEIRGVQAENELLREQIAALRERCEQGRELELRREAPADEEQ
jgi:Tfp pilus assembly protein PilN